MSKEKENLQDELTEEQTEHKEQEMPDAESQAPEEEVPEEKSELEKLQEAYDSLNDKYMRLYADFENFRKRSQKERFETAAYALSGLLEKLLPFMDNLDRAVAAQGDAESLQKGFEMAAAQFKEILANEGLEEIAAEGAAFDPNLHHGVMTGSDENLAEDIVMDVLQKGYKYKDKVLRASMVKVNKLN